MSTIDNGSFPVALAISDLHLWDRKPRARAESQEEWLQVQDDYLLQVSKLCQQYRVPLLIAGDIFDEYNPSNYLVNQVITWFKRIPVPIYAIPGQHDLHFHNYADIKRTGYWTLVEARAINHLAPMESHCYRIDSPQGVVICDTFVRVVGFPWGFAEKQHVQTWRKGMELRQHNIPYLNIALIHKYLYSTTDTMYAGASQESQYYRALLPFRDNGINLMVSGDNHKRWDSNTYTFRAVNCGGFMRRHMDEIKHKPRVVLIKNTGDFHSILLDTSKDRFVETEDVKKKENQAILNLVQSLQGSIDNLEDFAKQLTEAANKQSLAVKQKLLGIIQEAKSHVDAGRV